MKRHAQGAGLLEARTTALNALILTHGKSVPSFIFAQIHSKLELYLEYIIWVYL